jgi:hypothetical protein
MQKTDSIAAIGLCGTSIAELRSSQQPVIGGIFFCTFTSSPTFSFVPSHFMVTVSPSTDSTLHVSVAAQAMPTVTAKAAAIAAAMIFFTVKTS